MFRVDLQWTVLVLLSIFSVVLCDWVPPNPENHDVCNSQPCKDRGTEYLNNMRRSVHPCEDFYAFACGAWEWNHPRPPYIEWDVTHRMTEDTLTILKDLLEKLPLQQTDRELKKLKFVYDTCLEIPYFDKHKPEDIRKEILRIRQYPVNQVWDRHNEYLKLTGESAFFDFDVGGFDDNIQLPMLQLTEPVSAFGSIYHKSKWESSEKQNYVRALVEMLSSLGLPDSLTDLKERIVNACHFRNKLNAILKDIYELGSDMEWMQMTPGKLQEEFVQLAFPSYRNMHTIAIPWVQITRTLFHKMAPLVTKKDIIIFHRVEYFRRLANLLGESSEQEIADHMEIYFIERHLSRTERIMQLLKNTWKDPPATMKYLRFDEPRWTTCIKKCGMMPTLAKLFIDKWFKVEFQHQATNILGGIKSAIKTQVSESKWLDKDSKASISERLDKVQQLIGQPTKARESYSPVKSVYPNAFLDMKHDIMFVSAAMLQSPIFNPNLPLLYNLGTTGSLLGHEFYHVIGNCGRHTVSETETIDLWSKKMRNKCEDRKNCFITQFNKFTELEFKRRYNLSPKVDTTYNFQENYPDVMGVEAAYMFHSKILKRDRGKCFVLPGFEDYSCDQMFFISFANIFCGIPPARKALAAMESDPHSLSTVRVNGVLSSTKAFATAFQCGKKDRMNPSTRCNLWI